MREIKFRCWDIINQKMMFPEAHLVFTVETKAFDKNILIIEQPEYLKLMQFTGLLDKKGKEIYESDLLSNGDSIMEVVWNQGSWTLNGLENLITERVDHTKFLEVIGNIYETRTESGV